MSEHDDSDSTSTSSIHEENENGSTSESEEDENEEGLGMYGNEPEYSDAEMLRARDENNENEGDIGNEEDESDAESVDLDSSRLENMHWCCCRNCDIMPTVMESKCCMEFERLLGAKLENGCVTSHPHFEDVALKEHILETSFIQHRRYHNNFVNVAGMSDK